MTTQRPLVSIALCTWNGERYLFQQLDSLLAQQYGPLELVACDDASTDGSWEVLQQFAPRFPQVRLVRNPITLGANANFQQALSMCRGDWIAPCDQDDIWAPNKISRLLDQAGDACLVYCDSELIDGEGRRLGARVSSRLPMLSGSQPGAFAFGNCVSGHASIFRRSLLKDVPPVPPGLFYDEWLAFVASNLGSIRFIDEALIQFRQHEGNLTSFTGHRDAARPTPAQQHAKHANRLAALAGYAGPAQARLRALSALWKARESQWLSPRLAAFVYRHHGELTQLDPKAHRRPASHWAMKMFWGLRTKTLVSRWRRTGRGAREVGP